MGIKAKLGLGVATIALGMSLIGGGTLAYFNDTSVTNNTFAAGTLDLNATPTTIINVSNMKPGDKMLRSFILANNGSLDIKKVLLHTSYTVTDSNGNNVEDFGKHIRVNFLINADLANQVIYTTTLSDLQAMTPDAIEMNFFSYWIEQAHLQGALKPGESDKLFVQFEFIDNGLNQNQFQADALQLNWTFEGKQGNGSQI
jgi:spore coat-associated protein N